MSDIVQGDGPTQLQFMHFHFEADSAAHVFLPTCRRAGIDDKAIFEFISRELGGTIVLDGRGHVYRGTMDDHAAVAKSALRHKCFKRIEFENVLKEKDAIAAVKAVRDHGGNTIKAISIDFSSQAVVEMISQLEFLESVDLFGPFGGLPKTCGPYNPAWNAPLADMPSLTRLLVPTLPPGFANPRLRELVCTDTSSIGGCSMEDGYSYDLPELEKLCIVPGDKEDFVADDIVARFTAPSLRTLEVICEATCDNECVPSSCSIVQYMHGVYGCGNRPTEYGCAPGVD